MPAQTFSRRTFLKVIVHSTVGTAVIGTSGLTYVKEIEPDWIDIVPVNLVLPRLPRKFHGYRIVQISDIHADDWMTGERVAEIVAQVNQQEPDLVAITGDIIDYPPEYVADDMIAALSDLAPRDVTVAVLGNHDHWQGAEGVRQIVHASGIIELNNTVHTLQRSGEMLHIAGVDDVWEEQDRLDLVLEQLPAAGGAILLAHEPDFADESAATGRFDLQLSGHSHGGQVVVPFMGPPVLPYLGEKYPLGLYQVGSMLQYTNRGIGTVRPRVRFNCRPEITVITLSSAN